VPRNILYFTAFLMSALAFAAVPGSAGNQGAYSASGLPERYSPKILHSAAGPIHLGDQHLPDWSQLYGNCLECDFYIILPVRRLTVILQTYGLEINAPVYLNYRKVAVLPRQAGIHRAAKPEQWCRDRVITLPTDKLSNGLNRIIITTGLVPRPKFSGDLDDFQLRNLRIILE
jgi:hypothetical protein